MRVRTFVPLAVFLFTLLTFAGESRAQCDNGSTAAWFFITNPSHDPGIPYDSYCELEFDGAVDTLAVAVYAVPFSKARCTVPDPPFGFIWRENWFYPHTGDRATGLEFDMGGCTGYGTVMLGEIYVYHASEYWGACASWEVGMCEIQGCDNEWLPAQSIPQKLGGMNNFGCICDGWQFCYSLPPYDLYPPDGATDIPLSVELTWKAPYGWECGVSLGTDPTCATMQHYSVPCETDAFAPGSLQPYSTYYWRPRWASDYEWGCAGSAAVHSFTTGGTTAVEKTTWGHVKALYR